MTKINWALVILILGAIIQLFVGWNSSTIATVIVAAGLIIGVLTMIRITINGVNDKGKGAIMLMTIILGILLVFGLSAAGLVKESAQVASLSTTETGIQAQVGAEGNAVLKLNARNGTGGTYISTGTVYALKPGVVSDRYNLMKKIYDGDLFSLTPNSMTLSSGVYSINGYSARIGDQVTFAGYYDSSPAAAENVSFVKTATITGITAGSNPEWMLSDAQLVWYDYPTLAFYDPTETARTVYTEDEDASVQKTLSFDMFPTNNGEQWTDASIWVESPSANIAAITHVKVTGVDMNGASYVYDYGMPYEISSADNLFKATPALTTSTNKMYYIGKIADSVRTSTTQKGKVHFEVTYDHPASGSVNFYFKAVQNTNALTTTGHYQSPATNLNLNATTTGTDGWT